MTEVAEPSSPAGRPGAPPARRAPADLPFTLRRPGARRGRSPTRGSEPAWLRDDRLAGARRVRGAAGREQPAVHAVRRPASSGPRRRALPYRRRRTPVDPAAAARPDDVAGLIELRRGRASVRSLVDAGAAAAGVRLLTLAGARRDPTRRSPDRSSKARRSCRPTRSWPSWPARPGPQASSSTSRPASASTARSSFAGRWAPRGPSSGARSSCSRTAPRRRRRGAGPAATPSMRRGAGAAVRHDRDPARRPCPARHGRAPGARSGPRRVPAASRRARRGR